MLSLANSMIQGDHQIECLSVKVVIEHLSPAGAHDQCMVDYITPSYWLTAEGGVMFHQKISILTKTAYE